MLDTVIIVVAIGIVTAAVTMYYRTLEENSKTKRNFRNDGQLHILYP